MESLRKYLLNDVSEHVGQAKIAAGLTIRQALVVEAEQVQQRGVEIMEMDRVLNRPKTEFIGGPVRHSPFGPATGEPH